MSRNVISEKRVKRLNRTLGTDFVHASTSSTGEWWVWHCIHPDGSSEWVNTRTGEREPSDMETTTTRRLRGLDGSA